MHITKIEQAAEEYRNLKALEEQKQRLFAMIGLNAYFNGHSSAEYRQGGNAMNHRVAMAAREAMIAVYDSEIALVKARLIEMGVEL